MRYFLFISYDGTSYHGWQRQPNAVSVQEKLEDALKLIFGRDVSATAAGRTDTGVHARRQCAHIDTLEELDTQWLRFKLNCLLPPDVAVRAVVPVCPDAHARFSAISRTYHYYLSLQKEPFTRPYTCRLYQDLDFELMNQGAALLLRTRDFGSFCKTGSDNKTNICHLTEARWTRMDNGTWRFRITADRFLRNMVRAVVGTLVSVGRHRLTLDGLEEVIRASDRRASGESMPACGLFLEEVVYPDSVYIDGRQPEKL